jgi:hypothetical protein
MHRRFSPPNNSRDELDCHIHVFLAHPAQNHYPKRISLPRFIPAAASHPPTLQYKLVSINKLVFANEKANPKTSRCNT